MSVNEQNREPGCCEAESISQAAERLGVTERTVYRMLRAGKIRRIRVSDESDKYVRKVLRWASGTISEVHGDAGPASNVSDNSLTQVLHALEAQLQQKDEQIRRLLDVQQELAKSVERVQGKLFDVSQAVIALQSELQHARAQSAAAESESGNSPRKRGFLEQVTDRFRPRGSKPGE